MKITIEIDSGTKIDKYSEIFNEIAQTGCVLGGNAGLIEHIGVRRVDDGHGSWQLVLTINFAFPHSDNNTKKWRIEKYLDTRVSGCKIKEIMTKETRLFIDARIAEANKHSSDLELYRSAVN